MSAALFTTSQPSAYVIDRRFGVYGEQRNRGLELSVFGTPARGVRLLGGLTLLDAEQRVTAGGINQGKDVIGVPETQVNLGVDWEVAGGDGLTLSARLVHRPPLCRRRQSAAAAFMGAPRPGRKLRHAYRRPRGDAARAHR
jgi:iron complex outermembrane receptor protein